MGLRVPTSSILVLAWLLVDEQKKLDLAPGFNVQDGPQGAEVKRTDAAVMIGSSLGATGAAAVGVFATVFCAAPPSLVAIVGVGGTLAAARLEPYRLYFIVVAFALLGIAGWRAYASRRTSESAGPVRMAKMARIIVGVAVVFTVASALAAGLLR
jgi:hypothetical protein